jgi:hypothetical protein
MAFPKTLQELQAAFPDEEACWEQLRRTRWPDGFVCPRCGGQESSWIATRRLEQCRRCRYQCSVTAGTVFHRTRLPLRTWFWAIFFLARHKKGISALQLQRDTGIGSYQTAWTAIESRDGTAAPFMHRPRRKLDRRVRRLGPSDAQRSGDSQDPWPSDPESRHIDGASFRKRGRAATREGVAPRGVAWRRARAQIGRLPIFHLSAEPISRAGLRPPRRYASRRSRVRRWRARRRRRSRQGAAQPADT